MEFSEQEILKPLSPQQLQAVTHAQGPLLVVAGAGTGKTTVLSRRISWLIASKRAKPDQVLALTFNEKAATEMEERVDVLVPYGYAPVNLLTFHAFGDRLLKEHALRLGLMPDADVLSGAPLRLFLREKLFKLPLKRFRPLARPDSHVEELIKLFSRAKDEAVFPDDYRRAAQALAKAVAQEPENEELKQEAEEQAELAEAYAAFDDLLHREGFIDHGDQVLLSLRLLREHPSVLKKVQQSFTHILVDEFQDTNTAQFEILKLLCPSQGPANITAVGDDDQAIYRFRGASLANILDFKRAYPQARVVALTENYRSTQEILDTAYRLIQFNNPERLEVKEAFSKRLQSKKESKSSQSVFFTPYDRASSEADSIARHIAEAVQSGKRGYKDFAILVRSNGQAEGILHSLRYAGIPSRFTGARGLYQQPEIRLCLSFLRALANPSDDLSLFDLLVSELYRTPTSDLRVLFNYAQRRHMSLYSLITRSSLARDGEDTELDPEAWEAVSKALNDLMRYSEMANQSGVSEVLYAFLEESGYLRRLTKAGPGTEAKLGNLARFFERIKQYDQLGMSGRLQRVVDYIQDLIEEGDNPAVTEAELDAEAVVVSTIHSAKGLEWPVVFLAGLEEGHMPPVMKSERLGLPSLLFQAPTDPRLQHRAEERRLFYVALTRAKEELRLSYSRDHGGKKMWKRSAFLQEALDLPKEEGGAVALSPQERLARHAPQSADQHPALLPVAPIPEGQALRFSYYPIDDYLTCPLKYKFIHVLKLRPPLTHSMVYGQAFHHAVQAYHQAKMEGRPYSLDQLKAAFREAWRAEGFHSREHEDERLSQGEKRLEAFFETEEKAGRVPYWIEKPFSVHLPGNNKLEGRFDRVDRDEQGRACIIDYKTSNVHEQKKANDEVKKSLQLAIYALGYKELQGELPQRLELHFVESGLVASLEPDEKYMGAKLQEVTKAIEGIRAARFDATPDYMDCKFCNFNRICPSSLFE